MWKSLIFLNNLSQTQRVFVRRDNLSCFDYMYPPFHIKSTHVRGLILVAETCNTTSCLRYVMACKWEEAIKCNGEMLIWRNLAMEVGKIALVAIVYNLWKQGTNNFFFFFFREFQFMASALGDSSLSSEQDINQFLV